MHFDRGGAGFARVCSRFDSRLGFRVQSPTRAVVFRYLGCGFGMGGVKRRDWNAAHQLPFNRMYASHIIVLEAIDRFPSDLMDRNGRSADAGSG
jgi:hypothetical protein